MINSKSVEQNEELDVGSSSRISRRDTDSKLQSDLDLEQRLYALEERVVQLSRSVGESAIVSEIRRIADHFDPPNRATVGTTYLSQKLGTTTKWIGDLVRKGEIPKSCICPK